MLIVEMSHEYLSLSHLAKAMATAVLRGSTGGGAAPSAEESAMEEARIEARLRALAASGAIGCDDLIIFLKGHEFIFDLSRPEKVRDIGE
ncbi:MAG: hypothetical protein EOO38_18870 [Cytophagaceae bacterium]|nr:MAG: hypothetical protein EOO38_18870 [Cytophagaceae bacterium]